MKYWMFACACVLAAAPAWADDAKPADMDMAKMGPGTRKPTNEKKTKAEIQAFFDQNEALAKKGDFDGSLAMLDFPVYMITDDAKGVPEAALWTKEQYVAMMKPAWEHMPKDTKTTHKLTVAVLSDSLVNVTDDFTMTMGKQKVTARNLSVFVKRDGAWKWKVLGEAGWGGMHPSAGEPKQDTAPAPKVEPGKK